MPRRKVTIGALFRLWRLLRSVRPDVVQTWMYHADLVGGVLRVCRSIDGLLGHRHTTLELGLTPRTTIMVARTCGGLSHWIPTAIVSCSHEAARVHQALGYAAGSLLLFLMVTIWSAFRPIQRRANACGPSGVSMLRRH